MEIKDFKLGSIVTNVYLLIEENECVLIDCEGPEIIYKFLKENKLDLKYILLTHFHFDHINGLELLKKKTNALIYGSDIDVNLFGLKIKLDKILKNNDIIEFKGNKIRVISTPGHTLGSLCFLIENNLFSGDTLFYRAYGRTDLGGDEKEMKISLKKLLKLDENIKVYPGHGAFTTIEKERAIYKELL
ncbi:MBL fold metallo-hydrolase [Candidatus Woesearchaeota archaeon]|nr:MBL fold metallo-hydrolase [Candidatus Woesearchaeota archaeon]